MDKKENEDIINISRKLKMKKIKKYQHGQELFI
jgi:hypothetical protein